MDISIKKSEVFNEVEKRSSLEGYVIPERYDNVWANKEKGELLDSFWINGCTAVVQVMKKYLSGSTVEHSLMSYDSDEIFNLKVTMPARYDSNLNGSVLTDIKMMIALSVLHGWMSVSAPESAAKYLDESKGYSDDLILKLLHRKSPEDTLNDATVDPEYICNHLDALKYAEPDDVPLVHVRNRCEERGCWRG